MNKMKWLRVLKILWSFAVYLEQYWPEDSKFSSEKGLLQEIAKFLVSKAEE